MNSSKIHNEFIALSLTQFPHAPPPAFFTRLFHSGFQFWRQRRRQRTCAHGAHHPRDAEVFESREPGETPGIKPQTLSIKI